MTEPEDLDDDLFADLYDEPAKPVHSEAPTTKREPENTVQNGNASRPGNEVNNHADDTLDVDYGHDSDFKEENQGQHMPFEDTNGSTWNDHSNTYGDGGDNSSTGIKEDGKMFIGGLNWETTDQSLKDYFSQFGEVIECTVMRDGATGRSRGFGFLTFKDPKTVNTVMVKEHYLDGKIIDPKRAIPRDEQERTSKIFVGGVSPEATDHIFKEFFMQFGRVIEATLMMDKETGRPRGFGFVTFDSEAAVDATLEHPLEILGKPIEVKKAQPKGNMRDDDERGGRFGRRGVKEADRGNNSENTQAQQTQNQNQAAQQGTGNTNGMTPQMMAQYWQRMQQYFAVMQQQMAAAQRGMGSNMTNMNGMQNMNPAMMQQMMAMQASMQSENASPNSMSAMQGMNPQMMQQMQNMNPQMMQQMSGGGMSQNGNGMSSGGMNQGMGGGMQGGGFSAAARQTGPGYNAYEQQLFEQQKYEQQQARRARETQAYNQFQGGPTSWEGMYDDVPQPNMNQGGMGPGNMNRQGTPGSARGMPQQQRTGSQGPQPTPTNPNAPANAPTGPKNAGKPGANYRGGGRGGARGFHPYSR